ncbi:MAG: hypothetical protein ACKVUS_10820 [Saprospiraceae bacterium]
MENEKKRVIFICSLPKDENLLRFIEEIGEIEDRLLRGAARDQFEFMLKLAVKPPDIRKVVAETPNIRLPHLLHFSLHGDREEGLVFADSKQERAPQKVEYFESFFKMINKRGQQQIQGLLFNVCHSSYFAERLKEFVSFSIGVEGYIPDEASIAFSRGFYGALFDGYSEKDAFDEGIDAVNQWVISQNIEVTDGGIPYNERFRLFV